MAIHPDERRVAVIAVHGVGYTEPCATARHLADLLLGLGRLKLDKDVSWPPYGAQSTATPPYREFTKQPIVVPLRRPYLDDADRLEAKVRVADFKRKVVKPVHAFDERLGYLAKAFAGSIEARNVEAEVKNEPGKIAHEFMRSQLADYAGEEEGRAFDTTCMESERGGEVPVKVHVYEAYWADLARPKNSFISFFMAFYQLLFHLSSLSRTAVYYAALEHMSKTRWRVISFLQAFASRMLVLPIPILNLVILLAGLSVLIVHLPGEPSAWVTLGGCIAGMSLILFVQGLRAAPRGPRQWLGLLILAAFAGGIAAYAGNRHSSDADARAALAIEWWLLGGLLLSRLFKAYETVRRRAYFTGVVLLVAGFVVFLAFLFHESTQSVENASFWTIQVLLAALLLSWALMLGSTVLLWLSGEVCSAKSGESSSTQGRAVAAIRTGRLTLAVSASSLLLTTVFIWSGLFAYTTQKANAYKNFVPSSPPLSEPFATAFSYIVPSPQRVSDWTARVRYVPPATSTDLSKYVRGLFLIGITSGLPVMLALSMLALITLAFAVVPSLLLPRKQLHSFRNRQIQDLGNWYSHGLDSTKQVTSLIWHSVFSIALVFGAMDYLNCNDPAVLTKFPRIADSLAALTRLTFGMLDSAAATLAVSGAALAALAVKYGKTPLDIVLDVDNYLRTSPLDNTPRARIVERYVSLLRYIANRNAEEGTPYYDSIVIGAHSLGALISADLLHFLAREGDPDLGRLGLGVPKPGKQQKIEIPISLLTFGNPLRQLLTRFFPHLYWWVNDTPDNSVQPLLQGASSPGQVTQAQTPLLSQLRLKHWTNAYRSGDFVGRSVWLNNWYRRSAGCDNQGPSPEDPKVFAAIEGAMELCIGIGGHNDYWNRSAPDIAVQLDKLITSVAAKPTPPENKKETSAQAEARPAGLGH